MTEYPDRKEKEYKDGTKSYIIGNVLFFSSGDCQDTNTKEVKKYECKNGKIFIGGKEWTPPSNIEVNNPIKMGGEKPKDGEENNEDDNTDSL